VADERYQLDTVIGEACFRRSEESGGVILGPVPGEKQGATGHIVHEYWKSIGRYLDDELQDDVPVLRASYCAFAILENEFHRRRRSRSENNLAKQKFGGRFAPEKRSI